MRNYKPEFTTTERSGGKALWVKMPDGEKWNIWDLEPSQLTAEVLEAIESAFDRGMEAKAMQIREAL